MQMLIREGMDVQVTSSGAVAWVIRDILAKESKIDREKEHFWTIGLDTQNRIKFVDLVSLGGLNQATVLAREAFRLAVIEGCEGVVFAHNHPSGDSKPSEADFKTTRAFVAAGHVLGVSVRDHVIVGKDFYSFFGRIEQIKEELHMEDKFSLMRSDTKEQRREELHMEDKFSLMRSDIKSLKARVKTLSKKKTSKLKQDTTKNEGKK
jgi:DNA repair protein RadC